MSKEKSQCVSWRNQVYTWKKKPQCFQSGPNRAYDPSGQPFIYCIGYLIYYSMCFRGTTGQDQDLCEALHHFITHTHTHIWLFLLTNPFIIVSATLGRLQQIIVFDSFSSLTRFIIIDSPPTRSMYVLPRNQACKDRPYVWHKKNCEQNMTYISCEFHLISETCLSIQCFFI